MVCKESGGPFERITREAPDGRNRVLWLGGGSGAGKSTVAHLLAARHDLTLYDTDAAMARHAARLSREEAPLLHRFMAMDMDARWVDRSPERMLRTFHWFAGEGFALIEADLAAMSGPVIAEGFRILPHLVPPGARAVWLLPTPAFRRAAMKARGSLWDIPRRTANPERALANILERDALVTKHLHAEVKRLGLASIRVDGSASVEVLAARVGEAFGLPQSDAADS